MEYISVFVEKNFNKFEKNCRECSGLKLYKKNLDKDVRCRAKLYTVPSKESKRFGK